MSTAKRVHPSAPGYSRPEYADDVAAVSTSAGGRRPNAREPKYSTLRAMGIDVAGRTVDLASLPLRADPSGGEPVLDAARVEAELLRCGHDKHPRFLTVCVTEPVACTLYDLAANEAGLGEDALSGGDIGRVVAGMARLVGHLMPVFGQARKPGEKAVAAGRCVLLDHMKPLDAAVGEGGRSAQPHSFALQPVQLVTCGAKKDPGVALAQGVIVSNKCYNFPEGDERRVALDCNPTFAETVCWVLITHSYGGLSYAALGPPKTATKRDAAGEQRLHIVDEPGRNAYEHVFGWRAFMERNADERRGGVTSFGFGDIKQTNKDMVRAVVPWSVERVAGWLAELRAEGDVMDFLREMPQKANLGDTKLLKNREYGGLDLRRFLLIELLLRGTPLEPMLRQTPAAEDVLRLPGAPRVPGGAEGLYRRMKAFCDSRFV